MASAAARRVLVVEADRDAADALLFLLRMVGCQGHWVADAAEALHTFHALRRQGSAYPDAVLLDFHLPGIDGRSLGPELMQDPNMSPIVLVSPEPAVVLAAAAQEMGARGVLRKPFGIEELRAVLDRLWGNVEIGA
jgi:DNA-binding response OmpR family regulator